MQRRRLCHVQVTHFTHLKLALPVFPPHLVGLASFGSASASLVTLHLLSLHPSHPPAAGGRTLASDDALRRVDPGVLAVVGALGLDLRDSQAKGFAALGGSRPVAHIASTGTW